MKRRYMLAGLAAIAVLAIASTAIGGPSLKSLVKKEVQKQISKATGPAGPPGAAGAAGAAGTARAYARVTGHSLSACSPQCAVDDSKGVTGVTRDGVGDYCVTAPGIDPNTVPAVVSVDWAGTAAPEGNASALVRPAACGGTAFEVITERIPTGVTGDSADADNVGFTIIIP
jgi:hypothetical protein